MDLPLLALAELRSVLYYGAIYGITIAVAFWIYRDARHRGRSTRRAGLWAAATLVFAIFAVLPYLYFRQRSTTPEPAAADA